MLRYSPMVTFPYLSILPFPSLLICTVAATHTPPSASASYLGIFASSRSGDRHTLSQASLCPTPHHALGFLQRSAHPWRFFPSRRIQTAHLCNLCTRSIHHPFYSGQSCMRSFTPSGKWSFESTRTSALLQTMLPRITPWLPAAAQHTTGFA